MNGSFVKPPVFEDEGALHVGKGRFLLFMSGGNENGGISGRMKLVVSIAAVFVVLAVLILAFSLSGHQANTMPYKYQLRDLIGSTLGQISKELEVTEADWEPQGEGIYKLSEPCKMSGIQFYLQLHFDKNEKMQGFEYIADYRASSREAASDISKAVIDLHVQNADVGDISYSKANLRKRFKEQKALVIDTSWKNNPIENKEDPICKYLEELEADPQWPGLLHGYVVQHAVIYQDVHVEYTPENERVLLHISYNVEPERKK